MTNDEDVPAIAGPQRRRTTSRLTGRSTAARNAQARLEAALEAAPPSEVEVVAEIEPATEPAQVPAAAAAPEPKSRDIGNWKFTPWKGHDMWTHRRSGRTSFSIKEVRRLRSD